MNVAAVIVTRGDVDLTPSIIPYHEFGLEPIIWDNSQRDNLSVYGRYAAIKETDADVILVQDDDVILPTQSIHSLRYSYQPGHIVANMPAPFRPHYPDSCLVGFGAIFDRDLPERAFARFHRIGDNPLRSTTDLFLRTADVVFTTLTPRILVDVPKTDREFASDPNRMWKQPGHYPERTRMLQLARQVRDRVPA